MKLEELKVGDEVCVTGSAGWQRYLTAKRKGTVEKVTATQITAFGGWRFSRRNGSEIGSGLSYYNRDFIRPYTEEIKTQEAETKKILKAEKIVARAAEILSQARGEKAVQLAALLPDELKRNDD